LHAKGIVLRDVISGLDIKTKKQQVCRAGEFLVAEIDAKVGGFGVIPPDLDGAIVSSHFFLFEINEDVLCKRFLDYFVRTPAFRDQVSAQGSTNYAAIRPTHVLEYKIPLPHSWSNSASWPGSRSLPPGSRKRGGCGGKRWRKRVLL
jgi:type I restriction enzyme S subunit